jgi:hypothetical protein
MAFDELIHQTATESDLLNQLVRQIQKNYSQYQTACFFMKLEKVYDFSNIRKLSKIIWIKTFADIYDLSDFFVDTKYERACIMIQFEKNRYEVLAHGFYLFDRFKIWPNKTSDHRSSAVTYNRENEKMISRDLLEYGFSEISNILAMTKTNKAM